MSMISVLPAVKQMWPLRNYTIPRVQRRNTMRNPKSTITRLDDSTPADEDIKHKRKDTFSTHVMTQVDKLHAEGSTLFPCSTFYFHNPINLTVSSYIFVWRKTAGFSFSLSTEICPDPLNE